MKNNKIQFLILAGLSDKKLISKLQPIINSSYLSTIFLIRRRQLLLHKVKSYYTDNFTNSVILGEILRLVYAIKSILFDKINLIMGFYTTYHIIYSYYLSKIFKIPFIANVIGDEFSNKEKIEKHIKYVINADIVVVRGTIAKEFIAGFNYKLDNIFIVPNHFEFPNIEISTHKIKYDLVFVGALNRVKRIDILISSIELIKNKYKLNFRVCFVGDGELRNEYEKLISEKGLNNQFELVGNQNNVEDYLIQSKAFIMTSEFEGLPQAMLEALACGLPVIMPNISNIPDYAIDGYNALLVEPLNVEGFADAIYKLLTDDELYNKLKYGAEKFREEHEYEFSMENITNIWHQIFSQLDLIKN